MNKLRNGCALLLICCLLLPALGFAQQTDAQVEPELPYGLIDTPEQIDEQAFSIRFFGEENVEYALFHKYRGVWRQPINATPALSEDDEGEWVGKFVGEFAVTLGEGVNDFVLREAGEPRDADGGVVFAIQYPTIPEPTPEPTPTAEPTPEPTPEPEPDGADTAEAALEGYLTMWMLEDFEGMVQYTLPSWRVSQEADNPPRRALIWMHSGWLLNSWVVDEKPVGVEGSVELVVTAGMTKQTAAKTPMVAEYTALVVQSDGRWYVDPDSMRNFVPQTAEPTEQEEYGADDPVAALSEWLSLWQAQDFDEMARYALPAWQDEQATPVAQIGDAFGRLRLDGWIMDAAGTSAQSGDIVSVAVSVEVIDNETGEATHHEFDVEVQKAYEKWFVDPDQMLDALRNESELLPEATEAPTDAPTVEVTPESTPEPTPEPSPELTPEPTSEPTPEPAPEPTLEPTLEPTPELTPEPTPEPTLEPTPVPVMRTGSIPQEPEIPAKPSPTPTPDPTSQITATPVPERVDGGATPSPTPSPTPEPTQAPTPSPSPSPTPEPTPTPTPTIDPGTQRVLKLWVEGEDVLALQQGLEGIGYSVGRADSVYGHRTKRAVERFQEDQALEKVDGIVGPETLAMLNEAGIEIPLYFAVSTQYPKGFARSLSLDSWGDDVYALQEALISSGHLKGEPDKTYGRKTRAAVMAFQRDHNLKVDGVAGASTLRLLFPEDVEPLPTSAP